MSQIIKRLLDTALALGADETGKEGVVKALVDHVFNGEVEWFEFSREDDPEDGVFLLVLRRIVSAGDALMEWLRTVTGAIVSFFCSKARPVKDLKVAIEPVQDLNGYEYPWVGGSNGQLFDVATNFIEQGAINSSTGADSDSTTRVRSNGLTAVSASTQYTVNFDLADGVSGTANVFVLEYQTDGTYTGDSSGWKDVPYTFTTGANTGNLRFVFRRGSTDILPTGVVDIMLNAGSTAETWVPYANICPISGWSAITVHLTGINQWDEEWEIGTYNYLTGEKSEAADRIRAKTKTRVAAGEKYYVKEPYQAIDSFFFYAADESFLGMGPPSSYGVLTIPDSCAYLTFAMSAGYGLTYNHDISINLPSSDHDYHAYNGFPVTVSLGNTYYRGTLDVTTGVLTVTWKGVNLGSYSWAVSSPAVEGGYAYSHTFADRKKGTNAGGVYGLCDSYSFWGNGTTTSISNSSTGIKNGQFAYQTTTTPVWVRNDSCTTKEDMKAALNGVYLVYELAEPTTVELTAEEVETLAGQNYVMADSGDVTVTVLCRP